jgi:hypothetical protein
VIAALLAAVLLSVAAATASAQDIRMVPVIIDGATVQLAMRIYPPAAPGPAPTLVFNHGSTGRGTNPEIFARPIDFPALAKFFADRGCGGILSVAWAGRRPQPVRGVINFVGGWLGDRAPTANEVIQTLMKRGARFPGEMLWLYGDDDPFYGLAHSRGNFVAFRSAGGTGTLHEFPAPPGSNGHRISGYPDLWATQIESYLTRLGLPATKR